MHLLLLNDADIQPASPDMGRMPMPLCYLAAAVGRA